MSLRDSNMAGTALGAAFSFLLYASVVQGLPNVERDHFETTEAEVGQDITLPCLMKSTSDLKIANIEWKKANTKLVLYSPVHGVHQFWPNVTIEAVNNTEGGLMGSYLHLFDVNKWDSGIYTCDVSTFPLGSIRRETELKIKDVVKVTCSQDRAVNISSGENVTIHCSASASAEYRWTKNKMLVSESETLELQRVTHAQAGVYTLTVNTGNQSLCKEFTITVLRATTSSWTDVSTVSSQSYVTEEGLTESGFTTSSTAGLSSHVTSAARTMSAGTEATDDEATTAAGENITSFTHDTHVSATSAPAATTHTDPFHQVNSTTLSHTYTVLTSTQETATYEAKSTSMPHGPTVRPADVFSTSTTGSITQSYGAPPEANTAAPDPDTKRSHLAVFIIAPLLLLIVVAGLLYRRRLIKQRMALPPPFKPPPPPVKYTAARHEDSTQPFPTSRCNSVVYDGHIY